jgi:hypothetical protein
MTRQHNDETSSLASKQWHEPQLMAERILMVDLAASQAQAKGAAPSTDHERDQTEATGSKPPKVLPAPFVDGVDKLCRQLAEIHSIGSTQLMVCDHWCRSFPTSSPVHTRTGWQRPTAEPSEATMAPSPPTDFSPQAPLWQWGHHIEPQAHQQAH